MKPAPRRGSPTTPLRPRPACVLGAGYGQQVVGLASAVSRVPAEALAGLAELLQPLRTAVSRALDLVATTRIALYEALLQLAHCLASAVSGQPPHPSRLSRALADAARVIGQEPQGPPTVANALARVTGAVAAVSGRLVARR